MDSQDMTITHFAIIQRAKQDAQERMPDLPKAPWIAEDGEDLREGKWLDYIRDLEDLDPYEIAHESAEWDWVIYYHRAMELCQAVDSATLHEAEAEWHDLGGAQGIDDSFGLYELAGQLASLIVTRAIVEAVEECREELLELANNQLENM